MSRDIRTNFNFDKRKAFINGKIFTADKNNPLAEIVVTRGNKIAYAGSNKNARNFVDSDTEMIDLAGRLMLPGFIDAHTHFIDGGFYLTGLDLRPAKSASEFIAILKDYVEKHRDAWITGGKWNHEDWENSELPSKELIDPFTENTPVFIERIDKHMGLANSCALKMAGITKDTQAPEGGVILKDAVTGEPTGILKDSAMRLVYSVSPDPTDTQLYRAASASLTEAKKNGITGIQDISLKEHLIVFQNLLKDNKLTCRIFSRLPIKTYGDFSGTGIRAGFGNEKISTGALKAFADGSLGAGTAWFFNPYADDATTCGLPTEDFINGNLEKWCIEADKNKLQISMHAIGDRANSAAADIYEKIIRSNPSWDRRLRIEHAQHLKLNEIERISRQGIIVSAQPYHLVDDSQYAEKKIGEERIAEAYPFRTLLDKKVMLCFGSDWPVAPLDSLKGIYAAATRASSNKKYPYGFNPDQKITVEEAIICYTLNNAYASFEENIKGSIEPGKLADFAVLNRDILTGDPENIKDAHVSMTVFDGDIIYKSSS